MTLVSLIPIPAGYLYWKLVWPMDLSEALVPSSQVSLEVIQLGIPARAGGHLWFCF